MNARMLVIACLLAGLTSWAKEASVTADRDSLRMGEPVYLSLRVCHDISTDSITVQWPNWPEELIPGVEVLLADTQRTYVPDADAPYFHCQEQVLVVTAWDTGFVALPPFALTTTAGQLQTEPLLLYSVGPEVDHSGTFQDIKPPLPLAYTNTDWLIDHWYYVLAGLLGAAALTWFLLRSKPVPENTPTPEAPREAIPHIQAFEALEALQKQQLWQQGKIKRYHSALSDVFRQYLEGRYQIAALEATSDEIMDALRGRGLPADVLQELAPTLHISDLVKFAKYNPSSTEHQTALEAVHRFVERTRSQFPSA